MSTYNQLLFKYRHEFDEKGLGHDVLRAFLFELCNDENVDLYLQKDNEALKAIEERYEAGVKRLLNNEPMNYILGYSYFYGYRFIVDKRVLIPRYETEELVGLVLSYVDEYYGKQNVVEIADIGTGSGAIAIALKKEEKKLKMYASDISFEALEVARQNARNNDADVCFYQGDMLKPLIEEGIKLDILVSNPPYIPSEEKMEASVVDNEPHVALFGGNDGLFFYRQIFNDAQKLVKNGGLMFFEIGYDQRERITALAKSYFPTAEIQVFKDINRKDRMLFIHLV